MAAKVRVDVEEVLRHFQELEDPRSSVNILHPLGSVLVIAIMAVLIRVITGRGCCDD